MAYLLLLETSGNQAYLFATNRLRQNVGASELIWQSGSRWVPEAIEAEGGSDLSVDHPVERREKIKTSGAKGGYEVILATSGKALVLVEGSGNDLHKAKTLIGKVTRRALREAPGLDICGAIAEVSDATPIHEAVAEVHRKFELVRNQRPSPDPRFLHLPIVAPCVSSGLPARHLDKDPDGNPVPTSEVVWRKHRAARGWKERLEKMFQRQGADFRAPRNWEKAERLFQDMDWIAVVHADGNGMGQTFRDFHRHCDCVTADKNRDYIARLHSFSLALDEVTETAFIEACEVLPRRTAKGKRGDADYLPIVPLVLGGDDLTVLVDGRYALAFARRFLEQFEQETARHEDLKDIAQSSIQHPQFGAAAGVAIVKPHFPFHAAYDLAESLLRSAKAVKKSDHLRPQGSALDFHTLFDASYPGLEEIRKHLRIGDTNLYAGPYVTNKLDAHAPDWARSHHIDQNVGWAKRSVPNTSRQARGLKPHGIPQILPTGWQFLLYPGHPPAPASIFNSGEHRPPEECL